MKNIPAAGIEGRPAGSNFGQTFCGWMFRRWTVDDVSVGSVSGEVVAMGGVAIHTCLFVRVTTCLGKSGLKGRECW